MVRRKPEQRLDEVVESWGADTVSPTHQTCLQRWEPFSSDAADVRHIVSILAEALGVDHPDRFKAASRLGNTAAIVEQTRPIWSAWGMAEDRATQVTLEVFDPAYQTVEDNMRNDDNQRSLVQLLRSKLEMGLR